MKVQLIHPPVDKQYEDRSAKYLLSPPIGLAILAEVIKHVNPDADIEIFDGNFFSVEEIEKQVAADIIGISHWYSTQRNTFRVSQAAKQNNPAGKIIIGGPGSAFLAKQILVNHPEVDYVVAGDGEPAIVPLIIGGIHTGAIPNLYYRKGNEVWFSYHQKARLNKLFDLQHLVRSDYIFDDEKPFPISMIRGCIKALLDQRCLFCALPYKGLSVMNPQLAWRQIRLLREKYGMRYFWETGDTFIVGKFPKILLAARPRDLQDVKFRIYASPEQITSKNIKILRNLGVQAAFIGVENANDMLLERAGKLHCQDDILRALSLLEGCQIMVQIPIMYGLPGETPDTARKSYEFIQQIVHFSNVFSLSVGFALPLPGTQLFQMLLNVPSVKAEYHGDLERDDIFDYEQLVKLQIKHLTSCSYEVLYDYIQRTARLIQDRSKVGGFGITK